MALWDFADITIIKLILFLYIIVKIKFVTLNASGLCSIAIRLLFISFRSPPSLRTPNRFRTKSTGQLIGRLNALHWLLRDLWKTHSIYMYIVFSWNKFRQGVVKLDYEIAWFKIIYLLHRILFIIVLNIN